MILKFGSTSCASVTREQCMMSAGGSVEHCIANPASRRCASRRASRTGPIASAPNPKFAHTSRRVRVRTSGSKAALES